MMDPDAEKVLAALAANPGPGYPDLGPARAREAYNAGRRASSAPPVSVHEVREITLTGGPVPLQARLYRPRPDAPLPALVFFHGGGWILGDLNSHDGLCRQLAQQSGAAVISVAYRLAPEHAFPAAFEDALAAFQAIHQRAAELGLDAGRIAVGGDSAGGNLAAALCLAQKARGGPMPVAQLLIYPALDFGFDTPSHQQFGEGYLLSAAMLAWFRDSYVPEARDRSDWRAAPFRAEDLSGLPQAIVLTAGLDPLRDEAEEYARRLIQAGVAVTVLRIPGQIHGFVPMDGVMRAAGPAVRFLSRHLALSLTQSSGIPSP